MSIPPITANPTTTVELQDSCNCCWGRKIKKKKPTQADRDLFAAELTMPVHDSEGYNLKVNVEVTGTPTKRRSRDSDHSDSAMEKTITAEPVRGTDKHPETKS